MIRSLASCLLAVSLAACGQPGDTAQAATTGAMTAQAADTSHARSGWVVDYDQSSVIFTGEQQGQAFTGRFDGFEAMITLDPDNLDEASIEAVIDMASVDAGSKDRNDALPTKDWFAVRQNPQATFTSSEVTHLGDNEYEAAGTLTIKGVSQDVTLPFTLDIEGQTARAEGELEFIRTDYNVGTGAYEDGKWVGLEVRVEIEIVATRAE